VELLLYLVKNFVWIMIGFLLIRAPIRSIAAAKTQSNVQIPPRSKVWMTLLLIAGSYCILVSFWNLISTAVAYVRSH
jgi:hypothetical protein